MNSEQRTEAEQLAILAMADLANFAKDLPNVASVTKVGYQKNEISVRSKSDTELARISAKVSDYHRRGKGWEYGVFISVREGYGDYFAYKQKVSHAPLRVSSLDKLDSVKKRLAAAIQNCVVTDNAARKARADDRRERMEIYRTLRDAGWKVVSSSRGTEIDDDSDSILLELDFRGVKGGYEIGMNRRSRDIAIRLPEGQTLADFLALIEKGMA